MKKLKLALLLALVFVAVFALSSCNSQDDPVPASYTGSYQDVMYGRIKVEETVCSSKQLLLPECTIGRTYYNSIIIKWENTSFNYNTDATFSFQPYVESINNSAKGKASFSGDIVGNVLALNYYGSKVLPLTKDNK